ncbi:MAG: endonuclease [Candidatus Cloacimonetes bacterium]|nr:endonuclease [Candidatus Cloacimonadota bacterium]
MKKYLVILIHLSFCLLNAIPVSFNLTQINFENAIANQNYQKILRIYNQSSVNQDITLLHNNRSFTFSDTLFSISANDSIDIQVNFNGKHNIEYKDVFYFINSLNQTPSVLQANVAVNYSQSLYAPTFNKWDSELKSTLLSLVNNHHSIGYTEAREEMFSSIDNVNGYVECVYTGQLVQTSGIPDNNVMNCEHTWPQSMGAEGVAKSDLNHLFPTNSTANSVRGNLPFGVVVSGQNWSVGGSKRGYNAQGTQVFEPRDVHKGDVSRAMFYFSVRYNNPSSPFFNDQEAVLRQWHYQDLVSLKETNRNNAIEEIQNKRNPFIDHPEFVDRLFSIATTANRPQVASYYFPIQSVNADNMSNVSIPVSNFGNAVLNISSVTSSNSNFLVNLYPSSIPSGQYGMIELSIPGSGDNQTTTLNVYTSTGNYTITVSSQTTSTDNQILNPQYFDFSVYPNPVNSIAHIALNSNLKNTDPIKVSIYNLKGQRIETTIYQNPLVKSSIDFKSDKYPNGIYFIRLEQGNQYQTKKIIVMK